MAAGRLCWLGDIDGLSNDPGIKPYFLGSLASMNLLSARKATPYGPYILPLGPVEPCRSRAQSLSS